MAVAIAPSQPEASFGLGLVELRRGSLPAAIASLQKAVELDSHLDGAHLFLGIAQAQSGDPEAAIGNLRAELTLQPDSVEALTWLGIVTLGNNHPDQAANAFDRAVALKPHDSQLLYYKARAHAQVAQATLKELYAADPDSALVHRALAEDLAGSGQPEKAIAEYQKALAKQPGSADLLEAIAEQQQKIARFDDATRSYKRELTINPNSAIAMYNLGKIDVEHGQPQQGIELLRKAIAAHALPAPADFYLGLGLAELDKNTEAAHWLEQCLENQPSSFIERSAVFQLARVYRRLGRTADADKQLTRLKQLTSEDQPGEALNGSPTAPEPTQSTPQ